jgi:hypothetical protein
MTIDPADEPALPPELASLERRLLDRSRWSAAPGFRERLLAAVRHARAPLPQGESPWYWLLATAALVLVALNFTMSVVNNMGWRAGHPSPAIDLEAAVRQIQFIVPDMTAHEARRQAIVLQAGARMVPGSGMGNLETQIIQRRERSLWDMH